MRILINSVQKSVKHLGALDEIFRLNYPPYNAQSKILENLPHYDAFRKELYVGGKKRGSYARQMILGDILQYIFMGRGYYCAVKGQEERKTFIAAIMYACNLLILMEDISVDVKLRNSVIDHLSIKMGKALVEDQEQQDLLNDLRHYSGSIVGEDGEQYENTLAV
jgi:hypothetical protein